MSVSNEIRQDQIKGLKSPELKFLIDVLLNVVHKKISISNESKSQLQAHKHVINDLIKKKKTLKRRKEILMQGDTFKDLFSILLPDLRLAAL